MSRRLLTIAGATMVALIAFAFSVPQPSSPPPSGRAARHYDADPAVDNLLHRACANCHSSETEWPLYSRIGPVAWLIRQDVSKGRRILNLSEQAPLSANQRREIYDVVAARSMPKKSYLLLHSEARLSERDIQVLKEWAMR
jgi:hypothetical protein